MVVSLAFLALDFKSSDDMFTREILSCVWSNNTNTRELRSRWVVLIRILRKLGRGS